jgi:integrase
VSIHKRSTKRHGNVYDVRLRTPDGKATRTTFTTRRGAEQHQATQLADAARGLWVDPRRARTPFSDVATDWLKANPAKRSGSVARDESIVRVHLVPVLGLRPVGSITPKDVQGLVNQWATGHRGRTVRRMYGVLRAILNAAVAGDVIGRSPCRGVKLPTMEGLNRYIVTPEELAQLASAIGVDYGPMVYLGAVLGLRWGECAGLRVGRVDWLRGLVSVEEQVTRGERGRTVIGPPKSDAGRRTLAVPEPMMAMLRAHLERRGLTGADGDAWLFPAKDGGELDYSHWRQRVWLPACLGKRLGRWVKENPKDRPQYEGLAFHDLRRANATAMVLAGVDPKTFQTRQGHTDARITLGIYAQATSEGDRAATDEGFQDRRVMDVSSPQLKAVGAEGDQGSDQHVRWSGRGDLNSRPQRPERCALTKLRHSPVGVDATARPSTRRLARR